MILVPLLIILVIVYAVYVAKVDAPKIKEASKAEGIQGKFLLDMKVAADVGYTYENEYYDRRTRDPRIRTRLMVDQTNQNIVILRTSSVAGQKQMLTSQELIPFSQLTGCEVWTDGVLTDGIGKITTDGTPEWNAVSGKKYVSSCQVKINAKSYLDTGDDQIHGELILIDHKTETNGEYWRNAVSFTDSLTESVRKVMANEPFEEEE